MWYMNILLYTMINGLPGEAADIGLCETFPNDICNDLIS